MLLPVLRLDEPARDRYLQLAEAAARQAWADASWLAAFERNLTLLAGQLSRVAELRQAADDPYFLKPPSDPDPLLWVEINKPELLTPRLIQAAHAAVCAMDDGFHVELCDALGRLESRFNVFVERDKLFVYAEDAAVLAALGLEGGAFAIQV